MALVVCVGWQFDEINPADLASEPFVERQPLKGLPAPNFCLRDAHSSKLVELREFRGRPVALIFGSYS